MSVLTVARDASLPEIVCGLNCVDEKKNTPPEESGEVSKAECDFGRNQIAARRFLVIKMFASSRSIPMADRPSN